jgi:hypothetical protein
MTSARTEAWFTAGSAAGACPQPGQPGVAAAGSGIRRSPPDGVHPLDAAGGAGRRQGAAARLRYLRPGLAVILLAVAAKLLLADVVSFPAWSAPAFIALVLAVVAVASGRSASLAGRLLEARDQLGR